MGAAACDAAVEELARLLDQGYPTETLLRFLKAREWHVSKARDMLVDSLNWRIKYEIDSILETPIIPADLYRSIRDTHLVGLSGYSKEGRPVFAIGVGLSTYDNTLAHYYVQSHIQINEYRDRIILPTVSKKFGRPISTCIKVLDMTGLKLSALNHMKILTAISTVDDLNYPEKTETYYIVNAPYIFSACWKVVKPLLQERTRKKIHVLHGCGRDELLKIMDHSSLPHFCQQEGSRSSKHSPKDIDSCFSFDHPFHQELYHYIEEQGLNQEHIKQESLHVNIPEQDPEDAKIVQVIEAEFHKLGVQQNALWQLLQHRLTGGEAPASRYLPASVSKRMPAPTPTARSMV
uniref:CRAL-TRIO domain-containing protein n=1 Tax=Leersia perrieri TaxID=77586 RepID=A0A0D9WRY7_9ORYZ